MASLQHTSINTTVLCKKGAISVLGVSALPSSLPRFRTIVGFARGARIGEVKRVTKETNVAVRINLDGLGIADSSTGIPFLDHMLDQLASHGLFDVHVRATGDIHIDDHHTNEDVALAIGTALLQGLGDRKGINRFGDFSAPLDEALIHVSLDLSGRPHLSYDLHIPTERVGTYDTACGALFPVFGEYVWHDPSHPAACWKKFSPYN